MFGLDRCDWYRKPLHKYSTVNLGSISTTFYEQLFSHEDPKSAKKTVKLSVFFALWGSECPKAARRTLMKLTPYPSEI